jgi:hypothetical protein
MTPDEFYVCIDKSIRCICEEGHIQLPYIEKDPLEDFKDDICQDDNISFEVFKEALT